MNLRLITENDAAYQEIGFLTKSMSTPYGRAMVMPTAWKLRVFFLIVISDNGLKRLIILDQSSISKILTPEVTCFAV